LEEQELQRVLSKSEAHFTARQQARVVVGVAHRPTEQDRPPSQETT
jgi:hypothetical protein